MWRNDKLRPSAPLDNGKEWAPWDIGKECDRVAVIQRGGCDPETKTLRLPRSWFSRSWDLDPEIKILANSCELCDDSVSRFCQWPPIPRCASGILHCPAGSCHTAASPATLVTLRRRRSCWSSAAEGPDSGLCPSLSTLRLATFPQVSSPRLRATEPRF
jgi:hypothetical protein